MKKIMILGVGGSLALAAGVVWLVVLRGGGGGEAVQPFTPNLPSSLGVNSRDSGGGGEAVQPFTPITETGIQVPIHREVLDPNDPSDVICYAAAMVETENDLVKQVVSSGTKVHIPIGTKVARSSLNPAGPAPYTSWPVHYEDGQLTFGWERCEPLPSPPALP